MNDRFRSLEIEGAATSAPTAQELTDNERLFQDWTVVRQQIKGLKEIEEDLGQQIRERLKDGEYVGLGESYASLQPRTTYEIDDAKAPRFIPPKILAQCQVLDVKRLLAAVESGQLSKALVNRCVTEKTSYALVQKTTGHKP